MVILGVYMYYKFQWDHSVPAIAPMHSWIPVACIFIFNVTCTVGYLVVPWVMIGELYPQKVRGILGGMTTCMAHTFVFIVVKTYPFLSHVLEQHGTFILYGCISFFGICNLMCLIKECVRPFDSFYSHHLLLLVPARDQGQDTAGDRGLLLWTHGVAQ